MKRMIRPSLVAWLLTAALLSTLVSRTLGATGPSRVYLPIITTGHPKPGTTPTTTPSPTPSPTVTVTSTATPSITPTTTPTTTPTGTVTPVESFRATAVPSASQLRVGQTLVVTATVYNEGSGVSFGLPQYTLRVETAPGVEQDQAEPILTPAHPDLVTHSLGIGPGGSDSAVFTFQALRPGTFSFALSVSGEVCITGPPGCAGGHWSSAGARSLTVAVSPAGGATPTSAAPSVTPTSTVTPTLTPTDVPTSGVSLTGNLALSPRSATTTTITTPQMFVIVLDVSASMALNFYGQATINGVTRQCGFGPNPNFNALRDADEEYCASVPLPTWGVASEQRFSITRQAITTFINSLGPDDRVALLPMEPVALLSPSAPPLTLTDAAGKSALVSQLNALSPTGIGTPAATALRKARQTLTDASTPPTTPNGRSYKKSVLMLVDGTANYYLDPVNGTYLSNDAPVGWENLAQDQPNCGYWVADDPNCQLGYAATTTNSQLPRPIIAMANEGTKLQQFAQIFVVGLAGVDPIGLSTVASAPYAPWFHQADTPETLGLALTEIIDTTHVEITICEPAPYVGWVFWIAEANRPNPTGHPGIDAQTFGYATLTAENGAKYTAPIRHTPVGGEQRLAYNFEQVPRGNYALSAYVLYKGADGVTRRYDLLLNDDLTSSLSRPVIVGGGGVAQVLDPLWLQFGGNICTQAQRAPGAGRAAALLGRRRLGAL